MCSMRTCSSGSIAGSSGFSPALLSLRATHRSACWVQAKHTAEVQTARPTRWSAGKSTAAPTRSTREYKAARRGSKCPPLVQQLRGLRTELSNNIVQASEAFAGLQVRDAIIPALDRPSSVDVVPRHTTDSPVRVSTHPVYSDPAKLLQALHGNSHVTMVSETRALYLHGNFTIHGPAVIMKSAEGVLVEVLPGGQLAYSTFERELTNIEEVLGDRQGRLMCVLVAEHVEVCGDMELDAGVPYIDRVHKRVLSLSKIRDGSRVVVPRGGNLHYPVSVQPRCDNCVCKNNRDVGCVW